ncbi:restriction endonuclease subunit S [uncultured Sphingomonas sp.]|uniref:restriction endonuclease subunit S n=1 Tax=uncultured Sphingomonas sp. TaxID=158754 RepID=UPI0035CC262A
MRHWSPTTWTSGPPPPSAAARDAAGAISRARKLAPRSAIPPFDVPATWQRVQLTDIGHDWGQKEPDDDFTYIDVGSIDQVSGTIRSPGVVVAKEAPSRARKVVRPGTLIYSTVRPYLLNIAIVDQRFDPTPIASTAFAIIHPFDGIEASFLYRYLRSPAFIRYVEGCQTGIAYPAINDRQFFSAWFPLPPLIEQRRIVAKVDELMALCDALERESADARASHQTLVETLLATLVACPDDAAVADEWARLESCFNILFTTEASVDALKATVLELAVRGRLVAQDASESHSPIVAKLANKQVEPTHNIPTNWMCLPLSALGKQLGGGTPSKSQPDLWRGPIPWVSPKDMKQDRIADAQMHVSEAALISSPVKLVPSNSLLFVVRGMILAHSFPVALTSTPVTINQDMKAIVFHDPSVSEYLLRALKGMKRSVLRAVERSSHGTCRLDADAYGSLAVPLPPQPNSAA